MFESIQPWIGMVTIVLVIVLFVYWCNFLHSFRQLERNTISLCKGHGASLEA